MIRTRPSNDVDLPSDEGRLAYIVMLLIPMAACLLNLGAG